MNVRLFLSNVIVGNSVKSLDVKNKKYYYPRRSKYEDSLNLGNQEMKKETNIKH